MGRPRKYARMHETAVAFECTKRSCKWQGLDTEKNLIPINAIQKEYVCPNCGNNEFYGLLEYKK